MKKCPFCAEEIQDEALKCRYCGEMVVTDSPGVKDREQNLHQVGDTKKITELSPQDLDWLTWCYIGVGFLGGVFGVMFVRGFCLDPVEEIGFRMFWGAIREGFSKNKSLDIDFGMVLQSATFIKCLLGFIIGAIVAVLAGGSLIKSSKKKTKKDEN